MTVLSLMKQERKSSGLTEKQLKKQSGALPMLLLPTPLLLPQRLHLLQVASVYLEIIFHRNSKDFNVTWH